MYVQRENNAVFANGIKLWNSILKYIRDRKPEQVSKTKYRCFNSLLIVK